MLNDMICTEDNFLDEHEFHTLYHVIMTNNFPWFYGIGVDNEYQIDRYQFTHLWYQNSRWYSNPDDLISIGAKIKFSALVRAKVNMTPKTDTIVKNDFHTDFVWPHGITTGILYLNDNNGYTEFESGEVIDSKRNRFVSFPAEIKHRGTTSTDDRRVVLNLNYYEWIKK